MRRAQHRERRCGVARRRGPSGSPGVGVQAIVFDVDGTLYEQKPLRRAMARRLVQHCLFHPADGVVAIRAIRAFREAQEVLRRSTWQRSDLAAEQYRIAAETAGIPAARVEAVAARWMEDEPLDLLARFMRPGLREFLEAARGRGLGLGVCSDYPARRKLEALGIAAFFSVMVSAGDADVGRLKPHPRSLEVALRCLDVSPHEALYVGDRPDVDVPAARAAGVRCVIIGSSRAQTSDWSSCIDYVELRELFGFA